EANETPLGWVPSAANFDLEGLPGFSHERLDEAQAINRVEWRREILQHDELFMKLHAHLPKELIFQRELLAARLIIRPTKIPECPEASGDFKRIGRITWRRWPPSWGSSKRS